MLDLALAVWQRIPPEQQLAVVGALLLLGAAWAVVSLWAGVVNADIRALRGAGVEPPLELVRLAARINFLALNRDKFAEALAWLAEGRAPVAQGAEVAQLRARVAELLAAKEPPRGA
jgi:hypothetical protein